MKEPNIGESIETVQSMNIFIFQFCGYSNFHIFNNNDNNGINDIKSEFN